MVETKGYSVVDGEVLVAEGISKKFGATVALAPTRIALKRGTVHAIVGENGAGKSTLLRIISGALRPDTGEIHFEGSRVEWNSPLGARAAGVSTVYQEFSLVKDLSVAANMFLGRELLNSFGFLREREMYHRALVALEEAGLENINPNTIVADLSLTERQLVEIAKATMDSPKVLILDEPTSALTERYVEWLMERVTQWRQNGVAVVFISHRMREVEALGDEITVLRNGQVVATASRGDYDASLLVTQMSGRVVDVSFPEKHLPGNETVLIGSKICGRRWPRDVDIKVGKGEVVGIGGLEGQGQRELLLALYGAISAKGQLQINGKTFHRWGIRRVRAMGMAFVPADRGREGLLQRSSIGFNMSIPWMKRFSRFGVLQKHALVDEVEKLSRQLQLSTKDLTMEAGALSGGNQQKVVFAKWLLEPPTVLLMFDATRGVDIATKAEIYRLIADLANRGVAIAMYSTDNSELIGLCHRVYVMLEGEVVEELQGKELQEEKIIGAALGLSSFAVQGSE